MRATPPLLTTVAVAVAATHLARGRSAFDHSAQVKRAHNKQQQVALLPPNNRRALTHTHTHSLARLQRRAAGRTLLAGGTQTALCSVRVASRDANHRLPGPIVLASGPDPVCASVQVDVAARLTLSVFCALVVAAAAAAASRSSRITNSLIANAAAALAADARAPFVVCVCVRARRRMQQMSDVNSRAAQVRRNATQRSPCALGRQRVQVRCCAPARRSRRRFGRRTDGRRRSIIIVRVRFRRARFPFALRCALPCVSLRFVSSHRASLCCVSSSRGCPKRATTISVRVCVARARARSKFTLAAPGRRRAHHASSRCRTRLRRSVEGRERTPEQRPPEYAAGL